MMTEFPHLYPASRAVAAMSAEERIHRIRADRWIAYPRAQAALAKLEELISFPERARMPNLLIVGASGMGKTMIIEKFVRDHPGASFNDTTGFENGLSLLTRGRLHMPVVAGSSDGARPRRGAVLSPGMLAALASAQKLDSEARTDPRDRRLVWKIAGPDGSAFVC